MDMNEMKIDWGTIEKIKPKDIIHEPARKFIRDLRVHYEKPNKTIYICSDARNYGIRQILSILSNVQIFASAGNVVEQYFEMPSIVFAHGNTPKEGCCGAVDHTKNVIAKKTDAFSNIVNYVDNDIVENAKKQLEKIPEKYRAGILYFDQNTATIHNFPEVNINNGWYSECLTVYERLKECLEGRYTQDEIKGMVEGQDPDLIFLNNFNSMATTMDIFRIDLQNNEFSDMTEISTGYAMVHALNGEGSFKSTKSAIFGFDKNNLPKDLEGFISKNDFIKNYVQKKGGNLYLVGLGSVPEAKEIYQVK